MKQAILVLIVLTVAAQVGLSQDVPTSPGWFNRYGRWSAGVQGGGNMWINDFDTKDFTAGGNIFIRYALTRVISLGAIGGYDVIQSKNDKIVATDFAL